MMYKVKLLTSQSRRSLSLLTRQGLLGACLPLMPRSLIPLLVHVRNVNSLLNKTWPSAKAINITAKRKTQLLHDCLVTQCAFESTSLPQFHLSEMDRNKKIVSLRTVDDHLTYYESCREEVSLVNRITTLHHIAKLVHKFRGERQVLEREIQQGQDSVFTDLLNCISDNIISCSPQGLANILWALGKIKLKDHALVQVCEEEILLHDIAVFHRAEVCQILHGCSALNLRHSKLFEWVEKAVLRKKLKLLDFENRQIAAILTSFLKMGCGSDTFFMYLEDEFVSRNSTSFTNGHLVQFAHGFAKKRISSERLFDKVEVELLRRTLSNLKRTELVMILWAFTSVGKGSDDLFACFEDIVCKEVRDYNTSSLLWITWAFATRGVKSSDVFKLVEFEICERGLPELSNHDLTFCLFCYALAEIPCINFLVLVEKEFLTRDVTCFENHQLARMIWGLGKAGISNQEIFTSLEHEIMTRKLTVTQTNMIVQGFTNANHGSQELFSYLQTMM